jgi:uncharacterized protein (DUF1786 family)
LISKGDLSKGSKVDDVGHGAHGVAVQQFDKGDVGFRLTTLCRIGYGSGS